MSGAALRTRAFAKINWTLEVLGRRRDGYHEIRTILQTVSWADDVELSPALDGAPGSLSLVAPRDWDVPRDETNLASKALGAITAEPAYSGQRGLSPRLHKRIPP